MGSSPELGAKRTQELISRSISARYANDVVARLDKTDEGVQVVVIEVSTPLPVLGPLGPDGVLAVSGRAFLETQ